MKHIVFFSLGSPTTFFTSTSVRCSLRVPFLPLSGDGEGVRVKRKQKRRVRGPCIMRDGKKARLLSDGLAQGQ